MTKRKLVSHTTTAASKRAAPSVKELRLYQKSYKGGGMDDIHYNVFTKVQEWAKDHDDNPIQSVLYPGCHRHLTAALIFPHTTFVDSDSKVGTLYQDEAARNYVTEHYHQRADDDDDDDDPTMMIPTYQFLCANVNSHTFAPKSPAPTNHRTSSPTTLADDGRFDLLISLSAGLMTQPCTKFIRPGGYLLVNDSHSDARSVACHQSEDWQLVAYWNDSDNDNEPSTFTTRGLEKCFQVPIGLGDDDTKVGISRKTMVPLTPSQVQESIEVGTVRKRSFRLVMEPAFYLFQRKGAA